MRPRLTLALLALATICGPPAAPAQSPNAPQPIVIQLRPAAEPRPALKYRLVSERLMLEPGNAAIFYHRAILITTEKSRTLAELDRTKGTPKARGDSPEDQISKWAGVPIAEIPRDQARKVLEQYETVLKEVELGAARSTCDWGYDLRKDGFSLMIPEIQQARTLARMVVLKARLIILDGKIDEAMHWIETGMVLGRHVSQGPTLIQALVGVAIDQIMEKCIEDLIQVPGTPSLYWALADRPRPFIDLRYALEGERHAIGAELPGLLELDRGTWSVDKARKFADEMQRKLFALTSGGPIPESDGASPDGMSAATRKLGIAAMAAKIYPEARRALLAEGRPEAEVDAMPIVQVATLYSYREFRRMQDESFKWMNLPYWQAHDRIDWPGMNTVEKKLANPLLTMFWMLMPATRAVRLAGVRMDRQLDALQCIEAIRLDAAGHGGKLPATLESITEAPVPIDIATGKPFEYKVDGDQATLMAPVPPGGPNHPSYAINYVLKLVK